MAYVSSTSKDAVSFSSAPGFSLRADSHSELDFGFCDEYWSYTIRDFHVLPNGNLILLTIKDGIFEYSPEGKPVGRYSYAFTLPDSRISLLTCDRSGNFYIADTANNAIIKADRREVKSVSYLDEKDGLPSLALSDSIRAYDEDCLEVSGLSGGLETCTYRILTRNDEAELDGKPIVGQRLNDGTLARVRIMNGEDRGGFGLSLLYGGGDETNYVFRSAMLGKVFRVELYGAVGGAIIGRVRQWISGGKALKILDIEVRIERGVGITAVGAPEPDSGFCSRCCGDSAYLLRQDEDGVRVVPLDMLCGETKWMGGHWFKSTVES